MNKKVVSISIGLSMFLLSVIGVSAFTSVNGTTNDANTVTIGGVDSKQVSTCIDLKSDMLRYRSSDAITNGEVTVLQDFLVAGSFLKSTVTGYFGLGTFAAVKLYQKSVRVSPTGYVGPLTRAKIYEQSCSGNISGTVGSGFVNSDQSGSPSVVNTAPTVQPASRILPVVLASSTVRACTMEARLCPDGTMMPRDPMTCAWLDKGCSKLPAPMSSGTPSRVIVPATNNTPVPSVPQILLDGPLPPRATGTQSGLVCTNEVRICSDGKPMVRNMTTCEWVTTSCGTATGTVRVIVPQGTIPTPTPATVKPVTTPPAVACTMQIRFCPDGATAMPRDANCGWHPEQCTGPSAPVGGLLPPTSLPLN